MTTINTFSAEEVKQKLKFALGTLADTSVKRMEGYAKENRPWIDDTSNAKNSIQGTWEWRGKDLALKVSGNMEYSMYLELAMEKRYAILKPTVLKHAPEILKNFRRF